MDIIIQQLNNKSKDLETNFSACKAAPVLCSLSLLTQALVPERAGKGQAAMGLQPWRAVWVKHTSAKNIKKKSTNGRFLQSVCGFFLDSNHQIGFL